MKKRLIGFFLVFLLLIISVAFAHNGMEDEYDLDATIIYPISTWAAVGWGSLVFTAMILFMILFGSKLSEPAKKTTFMIVVMICTLVTLYLVITTIHINFVSESRGPVHYHADFEIWVCGAQAQLYKPGGFSNKQGTSLLHAHEDNRMHVEGVLLNEKAGTVGAFFHAVGGHINDYSMSFKSSTGLLEVENGQLCNGAPASLYAFVNGKQIENIKDHKIYPDENVPPGDRIKIIFTEAPVEQIDPYIKAEPRPE